jgi:hypothetical protein
VKVKAKISDVTWDFFALTSLAVQVNRKLSDVISDIFALTFTRQCHAVWF